MENILKRWDMCPIPTYMVPCQGSRKNPLRKEGAHIRKMFLPSYILTLAPYISCHDFEWIPFCL